MEELALHRHEGLSGRPDVVATFREIGRPGCLRLGETPDFADQGAEVLDQRLRYLSNARGSLEHDLVENALRIFEEAANFG
jgi:hypothetical protein